MTTLINQDIVRTALITGAAGGIGSAISRRIHCDYARVVLSYRSTKPTQLADELREGGCDVELLPLDLADLDATAEAVRGVTDRYGALHLVVHAAGPHVLMVHHFQGEPETVL